MTAVVKWFNDSKGYGFAKMPNERDVFCHFTEILKPGFKTLKAGQEITFDLYENKCSTGMVRLEAKNIKAN